MTMMLSISLSVRRQAVQLAAKQQQHQLQRLSGGAATTTATRSMSVTATASTAAVGSSNGPSVLMTTTRISNNRSSCTGSNNDNKSSLYRLEQTRGMAGQKSFHVNTPGVDDTVPFDFTPENYQRAFQILGKYPRHYQAAAMIPLLDLAQRQAGGWLPLSAMDKVAGICNVAPVRVYEVASFYSMFNRTPVGKYFIQLCGTTPCMICGSEEIQQTIEKHLGIKNGQTTKDGLFTLLQVECLGACANAPMIQLNDDYYECLTPATMIQLLKDCQSGKGPPLVGKWGSLPMNGQVSCEGPKGKTTLQWKEIKVHAVAPDRFSNGKPETPAAVKEHMCY